MKQLKLTTEAALLLNERVLQDDQENIKYVISTSTATRGGEPILLEMAVDAYEDGEWEHELSCAYQLGDVIQAKYDEWLQLI